MPLIELTIPEEDGWRDNIATRVLFVMLGAMILRFGLRMWGAVGPEGVIGAIPTFLAFAIGVQIMVLSVASIDLKRWSRPIGYATTLAMAAITLALFIQADVPRLGTDVLAFTSYATELAVEGGNPFAASMAPSHDLPGAPDIYTPRTDGTIVDSWSYPGGTLWVYALQFVAVGRDPVGLRLTSLVGVTLLGLLVTYVVPPVYGILGPASLLFAQNEFTAALGGLNDMWWALPLVGTVWLWATERRIAAAAVFGIACAMKQQPWAIALPLAVWVWQEAPDARTFARRAATYIGAGAATFTLLNLPWLASAPGAWLSSVLVPVASGEQAPLISMGVGLAVLNQAVSPPMISRATFEVLIYVAVATSAVAYWHYFEQLRWAAWLLPAVIFLWTPRSLPSYFHWFIPVAIVALFAAHGELRGQREVSAA